MNIRTLVIAFSLCCGALAGPLRAQTFEVVHVPKGSPGPGIKIVFNGVRYEPPHVVPLVGIGGPALPPVEAALAKILQVQRQGTPETYAKLWDQKVRSKVVSTYAANRAAWELLQQDMRNIEALKLRGVIHYGAVTLAWCDLITRNGTPLPKIFALKSENGKLAMTNDLSDDLIYSQLLLLIQPQQ